MERAADCSGEFPTEPGAARARLAIRLLRSWGDLKVTHARAVHCHAFQAFPGHSDANDARVSYHTSSVDAKEPARSVLIVSRSSKGFGA